MPLTNRNPQNDSYSICRSTGILTNVAAASSTAGHLIALRWTDTTYDCLIQSISAVWTTITGFATEQEVGLDLLMLYNYSASHSGGTSAYSGTDPWVSGLARQSPQTSTRFAAANMQFASTGALTAGTHSLAQTSIAKGNALELATGAGVYRSTFACGRDFTRGDCPPLRLIANTGILLRNTIAIPASDGTARITFTMEWREVPTITST